MGTTAGDELFYFRQAAVQVKYPVDRIEGFRGSRLAGESRSTMQPVSNPDITSDDFTISRLTFQSRYRWEIAPLSDLFVVTTRGSNLPGDSFFKFQELFEQSWNDRIVDTVAIKLRYRFGS